MINLNDYSGDGMTKEEHDRFLESLQNEDRQIISQDLVDYLIMMNDVIDMKLEFTSSKRLE